jgi:hypothetical protein
VTSQRKDLLAYRRLFAIPFEYSKPDDGSVLGKSEARVFHARGGGRTLGAVTLGSAIGDTLGATLGNPLGANEGILLGTFDN